MTENLWTRLPSGTGLEGRRKSWLLKGRNHQSQPELRPIRTRHFISVHKTKTLSERSLPEQRQLKCATGARSEGSHSTEAEVELLDSRIQQARRQNGGVGTDSQSAAEPVFKTFWGRHKRHAHQERAINKNGTCNIIFINAADRNLRFMQDMFITLVDCRWRYTLLAFILSYVISWLLFAIVWYLIASAHGDLYDADGHQPQPNDPQPCVVNMNDFTRCFLYSVESQMTIGYGTSYPSKECPEAIFVLCMQSILGLIIQAFTVGMVFAKLTRPKRRSQTLLFSRQAVVCLRDSYLCLQFRIADLRKTHIVDARLRAHLLRTRVTAEGEILEPHRTELKLSLDHAGDKMFLIWPLTAVHRIDQDSPLYNEAAEDLLHGKYEILVFLEGTIESTGQMTQARSSYVPAEVLWGHRFEPVVRYDRFLERYRVDHSRFDRTGQIDTPLCSAHDLDMLRTANPDPDAAQPWFNAAEFLFKERFYDIDSDNEIVQ